MYKAENECRLLGLLRRVCGALLVNIFAMTCSFVTFYVRRIIELSLYTCNIGKIISCVFFFFSLLLSLQVQVSIFSIS